MIDAASGEQRRREREVRSRRDGPRREAEPRVEALGTMKTA